MLETQDIVDWDLLSAGKTCWEADYSNGLQTSTP